MLKYLLRQQNEKVKTSGGASDNLPDFMYPPKERERLFKLSNNTVAFQIFLSSGRINEPLVTVQIGFSSVVLVNSVGSL